MTGHQNGSDCDLREREAEQVMTSGTKSLLRDAVSWAVLALITALTLANFQELRSMFQGVLEQAAQIEHQQNNNQAAHRNADTTADTEHNYGQVRIPRGRGGHYHVRAKINNRPINVLVDTGATLVALSYDDARRAGIYVSPSEFTARSRTANGIARMAIVNLGRVRIGDITIRNVRASVSEPGALNVTLLGMSFLSRLSNVQINSGDLVLQK